MRASRVAVLAGPLSVAALTVWASQVTPARAENASVAHAATAAGIAVQAPLPLEGARSAVRLAGRQVRGGRPYDVRESRVEGNAAWRVKVATGRLQRPYVLVISGNGKQVLARGRGRARGDDVARALGARIQLSRALRIAGRHAGGRFTEAEIDDRNDATVWEVTFDLRGNGETEVVIDARTGRVLAAKPGTG